jgi:hypothetical protein
MKPNDGPSTTLKSVIEEKNLNSTGWKGYRELTEK